MMSPVNQLLKGCKRPDDLLCEAGRMEELNIRLMERMLGAELTAHPAYGAGARAPQEQSDRRNGISTTRVKGSDGAVPYPFRVTGTAVSSRSW